VQSASACAHWAFFFAKNRDGRDVLEPLSAVIAPWLSGHDLPAVSLG
jgi:hypothetical protein